MIASVSRNFRTQATSLFTTSTHVRKAETRQVTGAATLLKLCAKRTQSADAKAADAMAAIFGRG